MLRFLLAFFVVAFFHVLLLGQGNVGTELTLDIPNIKKTIKDVPRKGASNAQNVFLIISLPMPSGETIDFFLTHSPLVNERSPLYKTAAGQTYNLNAVETPGYSGTMVAYENGIHATLNTPDGLLFIRRTTEELIHEYVYFKDTKGFPHDPSDAVRLDMMPQDPALQEHRHGLNDPTHTHAQPRLANNNFYVVGNTDRRILDLFVLSEKSFRDQFNSDTEANNRIVEIVNGVKAVWEKDFNLTINYLGAFISPNMVAGNGDNSQNLFDNTVTDANIMGGTKATVDLAHLFAGNGGGGSAVLWSACNAGSKANGFSGTDDVKDASYIPLVAHEMAHHLGADHTWTGQDQSCTAGQYGEGSGVEPGAGTSLAGYAGICGNDNIPNAPKGSFHHVESIREIVGFVNNSKRKPDGGTNNPFFNAPPTGVGVVPPFSQDIAGGCFATTSNNGNMVPITNANAMNIQNKSIPAATSFELEGSATDGNGDPLTYQWDQLDFALAQQPLDGYQTRADGPLFKSIGPKSTPKRVFPQLSDILSGTESRGERTAKVNRRMRFALMAQDGKGGVGIDTVAVNVVNTGNAFNIIEMIDASNPSNVTVQWNVAGTTQAPISCANVDILYSIDGGQTFPYTLIANAANNGSATVNISAFNTTKGRIKVKCADNIFFDINNADLTVNGSCAAQNSIICPAVTVTAATGSANLDLNENSRIIGQATSTATINISGNQGNSPSGPAGNCQAAAFNEFHGTFKFTVTEAGNYSFARPPDNGFIALFQTGSYVYNATNPCGNFTFLGANFNSVGQGLGTVGGNLQTCTEYTLVVSNPGMKTVNINITGPAAVTESGAVAGNTSYTYVAINNANNVIAKVDAGADFKSLTTGNYKVYGVSYLNGINPAAWMGQNANTVFSISTCAVRTSNFHSLTVTGGGTGNNPGFGQNGCGGTTNFTISDADIPGLTGVFQTNGTIVTNGTVNVESGDNNVVFQSASSVTLNVGFNAATGSSFTAQIGTCTALRTEDPIAAKARTTIPDATFTDLRIVPNPTSQQTNFYFKMEKAASISVTIHDMTGRMMDEVVNDQAGYKGLNQVIYDATRLQPGMFLVVLRTGNQIQTKKMIVVQ